MDKAAFLKWLNGNLKEAENDAEELHEMMAGCPDEEIADAKCEWLKSIIAHVKKQPE